MGVRLSEVLVNNILESSRFFECEAPLHLRGLVSHLHALPVLLFIIID